jgi:hypothetical protein
MKMDGQASRLAMPRSFWAVAISGLAWNVFGVAQFAGQVTQTESAMMGAGMTAEQVAVYTNMPLWMDAVFGIGTVGGTIGCLLLLLRNKMAVPVFAASLAAYVALFVGDIVNGVFAAFGVSQVVILTFVVAIAAGLYWFARRSVRQGSLG